MKNIARFAICFLTLVAGCFVTANAQGDDYAVFESESSNHFGIRAGLDINCPTSYMFKNGGSVDLFNSSAGFDITGIYNMPLGYNFYFEPGATLYYNTLGISVKRFGEVFDEEEERIPLPEGVEKASMSMRIFGLRFPVLIGYSIPLDNMSLNIFAGPVLQVGLVARYHIGFNYGDFGFGGSNNAFGDEGLLDRFDVGIRLGASLVYDNFVFEFRGTLGTCDQASERFAKMRTSQIFLGVGYNF